jgi:hypothetical protein
MGDRIRAVFGLEVRLTLCAMRSARISMPHALRPTIGVGEEIKRKSKVRRACFLNKDRAVKKRNV